MSEGRASTRRPREPASVDEVFGYLQRDSLNLITLGILGAAWLGISFLYNPVGRGPANAWLLPIGLVSLAALLTLALNRRHFYLASITLSWLLLIADGLLFLSYRNGYLLYFAIPIINLANYLAGPVAAGSATRIRRGPADLRSRSRGDPRLAGARA